MSHDGRADYDFRRTAFLESQQMRVMRISNDDVLHDIETVLAGILVACGVNPDTGLPRLSGAHPHPSPLPEGEGA